MYNKILLKLSGEFLAGDSKYGIDENILFRIVEEIIEINSLGVHVGIVIGGGNIFRGNRVS